MRFLTDLLPILEWAPRYRADDLRGDVQAGVTVAVMIIPQAIAYGLLAGVPPQVALYASIVPMLAYVLLGNSRELSVGPAALIALMTAQAIHEVQPDAVEMSETWVALVVLIATLVGAVQLGLGVLRLGFLVNFLSRPVVSGFMSAAALIISASQLGLVLGVPLPGGSFVEMTTAAVSALPTAHGLTLALSVASIAALLMLRRLAPKLPGPFLLVVLTTLLTWGLGLDQRGLGIVGVIEGGLPVPSLPEVPSWHMLRALAPYALTIGLVGFLESISVAKTYAFQNRYEVDADQELRAVGVGNLLGGLFGGMVVTGNISRTAVAAQSGVRTQAAQVVTASLVLLTVVVAAPLFTYLPKAMLAAMIIVAVAGIVDLRLPLQLARFKGTDALALLVCFFTTLTLGVGLGIVTGIATSLVLHLRKTAFPHTAILGRIPGTSHYRNVDRFPEAIVHDEVVVLRVDEALYFANAPMLRDAVEHAHTIHEDPPVGFVLDCTAVNDLDATAISVLEIIADELREAGTRLALAGVSGPVMDILEASGCIDHVGPGNVYLGVHEAVSSFDHAVAERRGEATEDVAL